MITQKQIADRLGVSRQLVGFALNGGNIAEATREQILAAAADMGYQPNEIARAMVTGKNRVLGFLGHSPEYEATARLLSGVLHGLDGDYSIKLLSHDYSDIEALVNQCRRLRLAGVLANLLSGAELTRLQREMERYQIPMICMDTAPIQPGARQVMSDDWQGCQLAIDHLRELGHRAIAFLSGTPGNEVSLVREEGYRRAMSARDLPVPDGFLARGRWEMNMLHSARAARALFALPARPTALFCVDDKTALVAMREARRMGIRVPEELSVVGFADLVMAEFADPPLTTIAQPFEAIGRAAVQTLLETVKAEPGAELTARTNSDADAHSLSAGDTAQAILLPTWLIVRESTAPVCLRE